MENSCLFISGRINNVSSLQDKTRVKFAGMDRIRARHILSLFVLIPIWITHESRARVLAVTSLDKHQAVNALPGSIVDDHFHPSDPDLPLQNSPPSGANIPDARLLLPDLQTLPPSDLEIATLRDGSRELRLSNTIWNDGPGPLELEGASNPANRQTRVIQRVYALAGKGHEHLVGEFILHPTHEHWHFEQFTLYELWTLTCTGDLDTVVSSSGKLSYCVIDTDVINPDNPAFEPRRQYYGCGRSLQGLSAGWGDEYKSFLDGQSIPLSGVQNGYFALKSTANPGRIVLESNFSNNSVTLYLFIWGERLVTISKEQFFELECRRIGFC